MIFQKNQKIRDIAVQHPESVRVFETLGIDYCCGGARPLEEACEKANVPVGKLLELLGELGNDSGAPEERQWTDGSQLELTEHIINRHHRYVREEAPRLRTLLHKVVSRHGAAHPELGPIQKSFEALAEELLGHMIKEERILFPFIQQMEAAAGTGGALPVGSFPSVEFPVSRMLAEHDEAGALTARIRELSADFQPPADACPSYRGLYHGLKEFEQDLHHHIHLENNILFPRALEMERSLQETASVHH
jgi:regulator of cell morphogenesis and NO signaling